MDRFFDQIKSEHGRVDVVYANAGVSEFAIDDIQDGHFDINVKGTVYAIQKNSPLMSAGGSICLLAPAWGARAFPNLRSFRFSIRTVRTRRNRRVCQVPEGDFPPSSI